MFTTTKLRSPSYRLHKSSGQAVVALHGRAVYLGKYKSPESEEAYRRAVAEWLASGRQAHGPVASSITINGLMAAYLRFVIGYYQKDRRRRRLHTLKT
jgi:hypothetical protein